MKEEKLFFIANADDVDKCIDEYCAGLNCRCIHYKETGHDFCLFCNTEMTRLILYVRRDYFVRDGKLMYVELHAVKSYQTYQDCIDNLNGDINHFIYDEPEEMEV